MSRKHRYYRGLNDAEVSDLVANPKVRRKAGPSPFWWEEYEWTIDYEGKLWADLDLDIEEYWKTSIRIEKGAWDRIETDYWNDRVRMVTFYGSHDGLHTVMIMPDNTKKVDGSQKGIATHKEHARFIAMVDKIENEMLFDDYDKIVSTLGDDINAEQQMDDWVMMIQNPSKEDFSKMSLQAIQEKATPGWKILKSSDWSDQEGTGHYFMERKYELDNFEKVEEFVEMINDAIIELDHHPEIAYEYNMVLVKTWSHDIKSIDERDYTLSETVDLIYMNFFKNQTANPYRSTVKESKTSQGNTHYQGEKYQDNPKVRRKTGVSNQWWEDVDWRKAGTGYHYERMFTKMPTVGFNASIDLIIHYGKDGEKLQATVRHSLENENGEAAMERKYYLHAMDAETAAKHKNSNPPNVWISQSLENRGSPVLVAKAGEDDWTPAWKFKGDGLAGFTFEEIDSQVMSLLDNLSYDDAMKLWVRKAKWDSERKAKIRIETNAKVRRREEPRKDWVSAMTNAIREDITGDEYGKEFILAPPFMGPGSVSFMLRLYSDAHIWITFKPESETSYRLTGPELLSNRNREEIAFELDAKEVWSSGKYDIEGSDTLTAQEFDRGMREVFARLNIPELKMNPKVRRKAVSAAEDWWLDYNWMIKPRDRNITAEERLSGKSTEANKNADTTIDAITFSEQDYSKKRYDGKMTIISKKIFATTPDGTGRKESHKILWHLNDPSYGSGWVEMWAGTHNNHAQAVNQEFREEAEDFFKRFDIKDYEKVRQEADNAHFMPAYVKPNPKVRRQASPIIRLEEIDWKIRTLKQGNRQNMLQYRTFTVGGTITDSWRSTKIEMTIEAGNFIRYITLKRGKEILKTQKYAGLKIRIDNAKEINDKIEDFSDAKSFTEKIRDMLQNHGLYNNRNFAVGYDHGNRWKREPDIGNMVYVNGLTKESSLHPWDKKPHIWLYHTDTRQAMAKDLDLITEQIRQKVSNEQMFAMTRNPKVRRKSADFVQSKSDWWWVPDKIRELVSKAKDIEERKGHFSKYYGGIDIDGKGNNLWFEITTPDFENEKHDYVISHLPNGIRKKQWLHLIGSSSERWLAEVKRPGVFYNGAQLREWKPLNEVDGREKITDVRMESPKRNPKVRRKSADVSDDRWDWLPPELKQIFDRSNDKEFIYDSKIDMVWFDKEGLNIVARNFKEEYGRYGEHSIELAQGGKMSLAKWKPILGDDFSKYWTLRRNWKNLQPRMPYWDLALLGGGTQITTITMKPKTTRNPKVRRLSKDAVTIDTGLLEYFNFEDLSDDEDDDDYYQQAAQAYGVPKSERQMNKAEYNDEEKNTLMNIKYLISEIRIDEKENGIVRIVVYGKSDDGRRGTGVSMDYNVMTEERIGKIRTTSSMRRPEGRNRPGFIEMAKSILMDDEGWSEVFREDLYDLI
jgi:pterin-4a-carbinolamine dehydratase